MAFDVSSPVFRRIDGRTHVTVDITEENTGPTDEWSVSVPLFATLTLFHAVLEVAGDANSIQPEIGTEEGWDTASVAHLNSTAAAAVSVRNQDLVRFTGGTLHGRSNPDDTAGRIVTRLAWVEGH